MPSQIIRTTCTMDCPDTCGLEVTVSDGKIQHIRGTHDHPTEDIDPRLEALRNFHAES